MKRVPADVRELFSYRLARLARANDRDAQGALVNRHGLTLSEWRTLSIIRATQPCALRRLAVEDFIDEGQMSRIVKALVTRGWVLRKVDPQDGRSFALWLTAAGEEACAQIYPEVVEANDAMLSCLSQDECSQMLAAMQKILDHLRETARPATPAPSHPEQDAP